MASRAETARGPDWLAAATVLGALLLCYYVLPVLSLVASQPPETVISRLDDPSVVGAMGTSVAASTVSTAIGATFGIPLAYRLARSEGRRETLLTALVVLPLVLPPVVSGMVLLTVVGPNTLIGELAATAGLPLTRSFAGVVLAQTFVASPFIVVTAKAAFEGVDDQLEAASRSLGKSRATTIRRVTLPIAWPGVLAGVTLAFARAMGEFGATIMLAYYPRTMPVQIWVSFSTAGLSEAFPVAVILLVVAVVSLVVLNALGTNPLD
ncbi:ABC transporter permease [Haloarchaeobius sp. FL176]|uniref:ABC transporter permease n=1 Tax=Haloarchaeobius sp. FL176 TaxID=2967129 RepID=UPI0021479092|nr:ABC transporter permease [Haloarchaeobius sp. FL176]